MGNISIFTPPPHFKKMATLVFISFRLSVNIVISVQTIIAFQKHYIIHFHANSTPNYTLNLSSKYTCHKYLSYIEFLANIGVEMLSWCITWSHSDPGVIPQWSCSDPTVILEWSHSYDWNDTQITHTAEQIKYVHCNYMLFFNSWRCHWSSRIHRTSWKDGFDRSDW